MFAFKTEAVSVMYSRTGKWLQQCAINFKFFWDTFSRFKTAHFMTAYSCTVAERNLDKNPYCLCRVELLHRSYGTTI